MPTIFSASWILPITSPPIKDGAVVIDDDRIVAVGALAEIRNLFPQSPLKDLGEAAILPGLINVHSHLELTIFRGRLEEPSFPRWIGELMRLKAENLNDDDLLASARLGCVEAIRAGVTTLADTSSVAAPLAALIESGQRGVIFQECFGPRDEQAEGSLAELQSKLDDHAERLAKAGGGVQSRIRVGISPHAPYSVSARLYERAARFALDRKLDVAIHAAESADEVALLRDGGGAFGNGLRRRGIHFDPPRCSTIKYFDQLGVMETAPLLIHCVTVDEEDIGLIAKHKARVAHCPKSNAKLGHGAAPLKELQDAEVRVGLGTDSAGSNNTLDLIEEARFCSLLHRASRRDASVCSADEMLRLMTIDGARALGMENRVGSLEAGKQADLMAIDLSHAYHTPHYDPTAAIIFSCSARDVILTIVAGRTLYDGHRVMTFDEQSVVQQARTIETKLAQD